MAQFEFLKVPEDDALADGAMAPFVSKHLLTLACPLPAALLAYVRLERLSDADLGTQLEKACKFFMCGLLDEWLETQLKARAIAKEHAPP